MTAKISAPVIEKNKWFWLPGSSKSISKSRISKNAGVQSMICKTNIIENCIQLITETNDSDDSIEDNEINNMDINKLVNNRTITISQHSSVCYIPLIITIPKSQSWISLKSNIRTEDDPVLRYVPYFGDDDVTGVDVSAFDQVPGELQHELSAEPSEVLILYMLDKHNLKANNNDTQNLTGREYWVIKNDPSVRPEVITALEKVLNISTSHIVKSYERTSDGRLQRQRYVSLHFLNHKYSFFI